MQSISILKVFISLIGLKLNRDIENEDDEVEPGNREDHQGRSHRDAAPDAPGQSSHHDGRITHLSDRGPPGACHRR